MALSIKNVTQKSRFLTPFPLYVRICGVFLRKSRISNLNSKLQSPFNFLLRNYNEKTPKRRPNKAETSFMFIEILLNFFLSIHSLGTIPTNFLVCIKNRLFLLFIFFSCSTFLHFSEFVKKSRKTGRHWQGHMQLTVEKYFFCCVLLRSEFSLFRKFFRFFRIFFLESLTIWEFRHWDLFINEVTAFGVGFLNLLTICGAVVNKLL